MVLRGFHANGAARTSFGERLDDHIGQELFAGEEGEEVFKGFGDEGAVGLLVGLQAGGADLVGKDDDVADDGAGHVQDLANFGTEVQNGTIMVSFINRRRRQGVSAREAAIQGASFGALGVSFGLILDLQNGFFDRLRMAPLPRWSLVLGPVLAALLRAFVPIVLVVSVVLAAAFLAVTYAGMFS